LLPLSLINSVACWLSGVVVCRCNSVDGWSVTEKQEPTWRWLFSRFFYIILSAAYSWKWLNEFVGFHLRWDLAGRMGSSACSHALHVLQQSIFTGWVAADDSLKGLVALDVVWETLEEGLVADGGGIVGFVGFGVGGFVCAVG
jgi:hypothetical protein